MAEMLVPGTLKVWTSCPVHANMAKYSTLAVLLHRLNQGTVHYCGQMLSYLHAMAEMLALAPARCCPVHASKGSLVCRQAKSVDAQLGPSAIPTNAARQKLS